MLLTELVNNNFVLDKEIFIDKIKQIADEERKNKMAEKAENDNLIEQLRALGIKTKEDNSKDLDSHAIR